MQQSLERLAKFFIYATFFAPLLVVSDYFIFPFIVPKILLFRALVTLLLGCYALLLFIDWDEYRPRLTSLSLAVLIFFISFALSTFLGVDAYHSFWDNHERMLGLFTIAHFVIYYFIVTAVFKNWTDWKWALRMFLFAGSVVMFIGCLQKINPELLLNQSGDRVASTLGNPIYVGGYGLFLFFASLLLFFREKDTLWRLAAGAGGILAVLGLLFSGTRGSVLGLMAGVLAAIIGYIFILKSKSRLRSGIGVVLGAVFVLMAAAYLNRGTVFVQNIPGVGRLLGSSWTGGTGTTRLIAWKIAVDSWKERPIFGWGPNNFFYAFNQYYNPRSLEFGYGETWFDNAHNIILNTLTVQGVVGLISYLAIFAVAVGALWRSKDRREKNIHLVVIGSAFLLAHIVQNITVFENPTSYLYFMFWLALVNRLSTEIFGSPAIGNNVTMKQYNNASKESNQPISLGIISLVGLAGCLLIFIFNIQPARANIKTLAAMRALSASPAAGLPAANVALAFSSPHIDDIRADIARLLTDVMAREYQNLDKNQSNEILGVAFAALEENVRLHPRDIRTYMSLTQISQLQFSVSSDARYIVAAHNYIETALAYSPRRQQLVFMLASMKAQLGKKDEAISLMQQAINDDPKIAESYWRLAFIYNFTGDHTKALATLALAKERGVAFDAQGQQVAAQIMASGGGSGTKQ